MQAAEQTHEGMVKLPRRVRKPIEVTSRPLIDALDARRKIVELELNRLPDRLDAATAFATECEQQVAHLRR